MALKATDAGMGSHWWTAGRGGTRSDSAFRSVALIWTIGRRGEHLQKLRSSLTSAVTRLRAVHDAEPEEAG